jgi:hypothetical protein
MLVLLVPPPNNECVVNATARYSYRNATIGSTFVARFAGM